MPKRTKPQISVIVPCYNVADCIGACLDSLAKQTFTNFEVVCIDDGSTDSTGAILDAFAENDARFIVRHQTNAGLSNVRNTGIAKSRAPYIAFADGDDIVSPNYLEVLHELLQSTGSDISCVNHVQLAEANIDRLDQGEHVVERALANPVLLSANEALQAIAEGDIDIACWGKLFKRELLEGDLFPGGQVFEDIWSMTDIVPNAKLISYAPVVLYCYVSRISSITRVKQPTLEPLWQFRRAVARFEDGYEDALDLDHATDDAAYCLHLVHRLGGQYRLLRNTSCLGKLQDRIADNLRDELKAAYKLALIRGVSPMHPQMLRAAVIIHVPSMHDVLLDLYGRVSF